MSDDAQATETPARPAGTERPAGPPRPARPPREPSSGVDDAEATDAERAIQRAADGATLTADETDALTDYFLGGSSAPGEADTDHMVRDVNIGTDAHPRYQRFTFRSIEWEEWQIAQQKGTVRRQGAEQVDPFMRASYTAAYATVAPNLGELRMRIPEEYDDHDTGERVKRPADTAELLRRFFRRIPGALIDIEAEVMRASKILPGESSVREVEAAGN